MILNKEFGSNIVTSLFSKLDIWNDQGSNTQRLLKANLIDFLCRMQNTECLLNATQIFKSLDSKY